MADSSNPNTRGTVFRLVAVLGALALVATLAALPYVGGVAWLAGHESAKFLDTQCDVRPTPPPQKTTIYAKDGKTVIATIFSQDREVVPLSKIPKALQQALVSTEDRRFYENHGVDLRGLIRSAISTSGGNTQGGSTLTMQYVKQIRYYAAGDNVAKQQAAIAQNLTRKMKDAKCAIYFENTLHMSKSTILDNYLNIAFFGEHSYGIQTAAKNYFGKDVSKLSVPESAMLVGLLRAPSAYDPFVDPKAALARRNVVLQNMVSMNYLSQTQADKYGAEPIHLASDTRPAVHEGCDNSISTVANPGFFCAYVVNWLDQHMGITTSDLLTGGYKIVTTLDPTVQANAQKGLKSVPASAPVTAALPVMNPSNGAILAMASSKTYGINTSSKDKSHTEQPVFTTYAAPGASTWKLFPLLTALSIGIKPSFQLDNWNGVTPQDQQHYLTRNCQTQQNVHNSTEDTYTGHETLAQAAATSSNTYFVALADTLFDCNPAPIINMAEKLHINALQQPSGDGKLTVAQDIEYYTRIQQLVLGSIGSSPLEMTAAYAAVANDGVYNAPDPIVSISQRGKPVPVKRSKSEQVVYPYVARTAMQILSGDTQSGGTAADSFQQYWYSKNSSPVAGKTGTGVGVVGNNDNYNGALWFAGMTPTMTGAAAVINLDHPLHPVSGIPGVADPGSTLYGAFAAQLWAQSMAPSLAGDTWQFQSPETAPGITIPSVIGESPQAAKATLAAAGLKYSELDQVDGLQCGASAPVGTVGTAGPVIAPPGATVTVCISNGNPPAGSVPPPPKPSPTPTPTDSNAPASTSPPQPSLSVPSRIRPSAPSR